ncbi:MAG: hypothetical protein HQL88_00295 [Magnetococcales bacterium]|nr:hypothetical protein [Magnetococcales bacterium]
MDKTTLMATLLRLTADHKVEEAQRALGAWIREDPEMAAQCYIMARLLLDTNHQHLQPIQAGLGRLPAARQQPFQSGMRALDTVRRMEMFLAQVRASRQAQPPAQAAHREGLLRFLRAVRAARLTRPVSPCPPPTAPLGNGTAQRGFPCPSP